MMRVRRASWLVVLLPTLCASRPDGATSPEILLRERWSIQSSADVPDTGAIISRPGYNVRDWYKANLPSTVLSALVGDDVYPDPYVGMNLRSIPGGDYPQQNDFANSPMPPDSPFRHAWWYRTEFQLPAEYKGKTVWLDFDGINYRANVWMNGREIASSSKIAGTWRVFEFDITAGARPGDTNTIAIQVFPPQPRDLAMTLVDWAPMPPDKEMGIWRDVRIRATGPVALRYPAVFARLNLPTAGRADLTVRAEITNAADHPVEGVLRGKIENIEFSQAVALGAHETHVVHFRPEQFTQLKIAKPRLWWPVALGAQNLYTLELQFAVKGDVSYASHSRFGIRQVDSQVDGKGHRVFQINGKNVLIRGAGYSFDMLLRSSPEKLEAQLRYVRDLRLNAIRLEGKLEDEHFFELCDEMGILVMPGWCCCDQWEKWDEWDAEDEWVAAESLRDQIRRIERHPSVFTWLNGSDFPPPPKIEKMYLHIFQESEWPSPIVSSASGKATTVGASGVKMSGPYDYVAPSFWYLDTTRGGAHGFNTETSPGPAIPTIESLRRMLPEDHLWPIDSVWQYHVRGMTGTLGIFNEALDRRYGESNSVEEYARKAQMQAYEGHRAMMEAYGRNKYTSTGIIQWMLNNAWPSMIWHLYDWYLRPGGSYYGVKLACEPLHVQYSYDDGSIVVVNSFYQSFRQLKVSAKVYNLDMTGKFAKDTTLDAGPDSSTGAFTLPGITGLSSTYFVDLKLEYAGKISSRNFYWLSTKAETLDRDRSNRDPSGEYQISTWTPTKTFADFTALNSLPPVNLDTAAQTRSDGSQSITTVTVHNPNRTLAFAVHLKVNRAPLGYVRRDAPADHEVLPILWQDNYFALLPGETRQITATYDTKDLQGTTPQLEVDGWNVNRKVVE